MLSQYTLQVWLGELGQILGKEFTPSVYEISRAQILDFIQAVQDPNPLWQDFAPPTFPISLPNEEVMRQIFREDLFEKGVLNGGNELEINQPIKAGDKISVHAKLKDIRKLKERLFLFFEFSYFNQLGEQIALGRNTIIRYKPGQIFTEPKSQQAEPVEAPKGGPAGRWDEVGVGQPLPLLIKCADLNQLVRWAQVCRDLYPVHYDREFAQSLGLPEVIVHGSLIFAFIGKMITDWLGGEGRLVKLSVNYRGFHFAGQKIICQGKVVDKFRMEGNNFVGLAVWTCGRRASGSALVALRD